VRQSDRKKLFSTGNRSTQKGVLPLCSAPIAVVPYTYYKRRTWAQQYYALVNTKIQSNFTGKDQTWMTTLCLQEQEHDLCHLVDANRNDYRGEDPWFYMAPYLHQPKFNGTLPEYSNKTTKLLTFF
jgi:hypothetical protein